MIRRLLTRLLRPVEDLWDHVERLQRFQDERIDFRAEQAKDIKHILEQRMELILEQFLVLRGRVDNIDLWIKSIAQAGGLGPPATGDKTEYLGFDAEDEDEHPEDDMTFGGLFGDAGLTPEQWYDRFYETGEDPDEEIVS